MPSQWWDGRTVNIPPTAESLLCLENMNKSKCVVPARKLKLSWEGVQERQREKKHVKKNSPVNRQWQVRTQDYILETNIRCSISYSLEKNTLFEQLLSISFITGNSVISRHSADEQEQELACFLWLHSENQDIWSDVCAF